MKHCMTAGLTVTIILGGFARVEAAPIVMDFGVTSTPTTTNFAVYTEDGFRATAINSGSGLNHFDVFNSAASAPFLGEREMDIHGGNNAEEVEFDFFGQPFDLVSLDVEEFTGTVAGTWEIVSPTGTTRTLDTVGTETFTGADWQNITSFRIRATTIPLPGSINQLFVDNITFNDEPTISSAVVPEPTSLAIWGVVGLGGAFYGWRRRRRAAA